MPLSEDARKELQEAVHIVRTDRFEKYVRERQAAPGKVTDPPKNDPKPPERKEGEGDPPKVKKSAWWGELFDDE